MANRTVIEKVSISAEHPKGEREVFIEKNTNERAFVRIQVPTRSMTLSEIAKDKEDDDDVKSDDHDASEVVPSRLSRVPSEKIIEQD